MNKMMMNFLKKSSEEGIPAGAFEEIPVKITGAIPEETLRQIS